MLPTLEGYLVGLGLSPVGRHQCQGRCGAFRLNFMLVDITGREEWPTKRWVCTTCVSEADQKLVAAALAISQGDNE